MLTAPQRFGGSMNLHVHLHCAAIDGVYTTDEHGAPRFHFLPSGARRQAALSRGRFERLDAKGRAQQRLRRLTGES
jgi:hypothetical protein